MKPEIGQFFGVAFFQTNRDNPFLSGRLNVRTYEEFKKWGPPFSTNEELLPTPAPWLWLIRGWGLEYCEWEPQKEGASPEGEAP